MSTARNIPSDHGLTLRMFTTGLMLVILYGAVIGLLIAFGISYAVVLVFAAIILFVQYWFSDKIALFGMGGHIVTPEQAPQLHGVIDRLCALADMKKPRVAIADTDVPTPSPPGGAPTVRWCVPPPGSCGGWTSPSSKPCSPTSSPMWPTETWP